MFGKHKKQTKKVKDDPAEPDWPEMQPFHPCMFFLTMGSVYLVTFLKFIEKSYAKVEFLQGAKKLVKYPKKKLACEPVTVAPEPSPVQVVESFDYSIDSVDEEQETVNKNTMA